jgi:hypothetical protein
MSYNLNQLNFHFHFVLIMEEQIVLVDHEIALHNPDCLGHSKTNIEIFLFQLKQKSFILQVLQLSCI